MNDEHMNRLIRTARTAKPDTSRVEYGFETRLMARIRADRASRQEAGWFAYAWKLMPVFAAVVIGLGVWNYVGAEPGDLATLIADGHEETSLVSGVTGD